jgi:hypothetical protein
LSTVKTHPHLPHVTLNSDGKQHPLENTLALVTLVIGIAAFVREERVIIMTGVVAAFVGAGLGFAHGGFSV